MTDTERPGESRDLPSEAITLLWAVGYWDGPMNGVCLYEDRIHWFQMVEDKHPRQFHIFTMGDDAVRVEVTEHLLFEKYVGTHGCYHTAKVPGQRPEHHLREKDESGCWGSFYDRPVKPEHFKPTSDHEPLGIWSPYGFRCPDCDGTGELGRVQDEVDCPRCEGEGSVPERPHSGRHSAEDPR